MKYRSLMTAGAIGAVVAAICCATPVLAVLLGAIGLAAWAAKLDGVVIAVLFASLALFALGLYGTRLRRN